MFEHVKLERASHGGSPGNGMTPARLSRGPLATEGEATPGPDDYNPYEDHRNTLSEDPTAGKDDPYVFDDVEPVIADLSLPGLDDTDGPQLPFGGEL